MSIYSSKILPIVLTDLSLTGINITFFLYWPMLLYRIPRTHILKIVFTFPCEYVGFLPRSASSTSIIAPGPPILSFYDAFTYN